MLLLREIIFWFLPSLIMVVYMLVNFNYFLVFLFLDCEMKDGIDIADRYNLSLLPSTVFKYQRCSWVYAR